MHVNIYGMHTYKNGHACKQDIQKLSGLNFYAIYDMNGREMEDTKPIADMFKNKVGCTMRLNRMCDNF
jgi:hypothetical protein